MRRLLSIGLVGFAVGLLAACGGAKTQTVTKTVTAAAASDAAACTNTRVGGSFTVIPGSAGAGQISYVLTLTNISDAPCYLSGLPDVELLDVQGSTLPTSVSAAQPGQATAAKVELQRAASAKSDARFSPDVPGPGEGGANKPCEPAAHQLQVTMADGGTIVVPVNPPTPVCEHGALRMSQFAPA